MNQKLFDYDYKNYVPANLTAECQQIDWDTLFQSSDVNTAANIFTSTLKNIFDQTYTDRNQNCQREAFTIV